MIDIAAPKDDAERLDWLRLIRTENVGPITFLELMRRFETAAKALETLPELARRGGRRRPVRVCSRAEAEREFAATQAAGAHYLAISDPGYPAPLSAIADAPPLIVVKGFAHLLDKPTLAIVGGRNASANGARLARRLATDLGARGWIIASGLARGIDGAAHGGAMSTGTVAVLAGGIDVIYPRENERLYHEIAEAGVLISEMAAGAPPQARHFPRRNRLVSGLARGVVVVEAALRSGSLITARLAAEQGREVFAVPGSPLDPRARGTNNLIRDGAALTEGADDVIAALERTFAPPLTEPPERYVAPPGAAPSEADLDRGRATIHTLLAPAPVGVDELVRQSDLTPAVVLIILLELELAGRLQRHPGNQVSLTDSD